MKLGLATQFQDEFSNHKLASNGIWIIGKNQVREPQNNDTFRINPNFIKSWDQGYKFDDEINWGG